MHETRTGFPASLRRLVERLPAERRIITLTFVGGFLAAAILVAAGLIIPSNPPDIWPDVVTAGLQVGVVTLLGAGITLALAHAQSIRDDHRRDEERAREDERLKAEYRLGVFRDLVAAYNGVKSVRRTLRALGLRRRFEPQIMSAEQAAGFHEQMRSLVQSQLSLERIKRELAARPSWFHDAEDLKRQVRRAEKYVNRIVDEWEEHGREVIAGASTNRVQSLKRLQAFLGPADDDLRPNLSMRLEAVEKKIRADLYGDEGVASGS